MQWLTASAFCLAAGLAALSPFQSHPALRNVKIGDPVPAFSVKSLDGTVVDRAACEGKVLLLLFVRPEQKQSLKALHAVQQLLDDHPDPRLFVLAVSTKPDSAGYFERLASEQGYAFPMAQDPERAMYGDFGLTVSPTTLLIDETGVLRFELPSTPVSYDRKLRLHVDLLLGRISREEHDTLLAGVNRTPSKEQRSYETRLAFARTLIDRKQFTPALPVLTRLASERKDSIDVAALLGMVHLELGRLEEAAECLDPFEERGRASPLFLSVLARLEIRRGNLDKAEDLLLAALKSSVEKSRTLFELGGLYEAKGSTDKALNCYRRALEEIFDR